MSHRRRNAEVFFLLSIMTMTFGVFGSEQASFTINEVKKRGGGREEMYAAGAEERKYAGEFDRADVNHDHVLQETEFVKFRLSQDGENLIEFHNNKPGGVEIPSEFNAVVEDTESLTLSFWVAFLNSIAMIIVTELGDKTFFIAAILAMKHDRAVIFAGAIGALALMTVLSAIIGFALPALLPRSYTHYAATLLFVYFGIKLIREGYEMHRSGEGNGPSDELEEVENELKFDNDGDSVASAEEGKANKALKAEQKRQMIMNTMIQAFTLTFLAEWGDRSQIATIALASAKDPIGVTIGGIIGHALCTGLAVIGGRLLASRISEKTVALAGGSLFLVFALHSAWNGPE